MDKQCGLYCCRWIVCFSAWCIEFIIMGLFFSYGTIFVALVTEQNVSETLAAWIGSLCYWIFYVSSLLVRCLSKYTGYRVLGSCGGFLVGVGLLASSYVEKPSWLLLSYGITVGLGCGLGRFSALFALPKYFGQRTSLANGLALSGSGVGAVGVGYLTEYIFSHYGLAATFRILALFGIIMMIGSLAYIPVGSESETELEDRSPKKRLSTLDLLRNRHLLAHCIGFWFFCFGLYIPNVHLVYMAENANVSTIKATFLPGSMAIAQTVGRLFFGHLASNKYLEPVASNQVTMLVCTIATTLCPMANSFSTFLAYAIVVGFFDSCSTINAFKVVEELVGLENLSSGYAIQMVGTAFSTAIGPVAAGFLYEYFGSYTIPFAIAGAFQTACVCILFLVSIKKKKKRTPILGEEEMFPKDLSSFQISNDSGIDSDGKETNKSDHMSGLLAIGIHSSLSRLSHMEYDICKNKSIEKKSTWCKYKGMFPNKIDEENIIILERETVL